MTYRLTPTARARLRDVVCWTNDRFGPRQAERYKAGFFAAFDRLVDGTLSSRSLREVLAPRAPADLRFVNVGAHLVLFRERDGRVEVTDVLHEAMDVEGWGRVGETHRSQRAAQEDGGLAPTLRLLSLLAAHGE